MSRWRILAVDDDADILELIQMALQERHDVLCLDGPTHVIEMIETFEPDLVILDIMMPKVTGYHLIELLRQRKDTEKLPIVILSAKDSIRDQKYGYKLGATTYLTKPFQPERLTRNINTIFEHTPPDRRPKRWTLDEARNRLRAMLEHTGEAPAEKKRPSIKAGTVHHREAETPEDQIWRG